MGIGPGGRRAGPLELMTRGYDGGATPLRVNTGHWANSLLRGSRSSGVCPALSARTDRQTRVTARTASSLACRYRIEGRVDVRRGYGLVKPILEQLE